MATTLTDDVVLAAVRREAGRDGHTTTNRLAAVLGASTGGVRWRLLRLEAAGLVAVESDAMGRRRVRPADAPPAACPHCLRPI